MSSVITVEDPGVQERVDYLASGSRSMQRDFGRMVQAGMNPWPIAGADDGNPAHPLGPPVVDGNQYTVDLYLQQPTRVTRMIMDLTLQRFIADRVFASAGGVTGGAVIYDQAEENELYTERDVQRVSPGAKFPLVDGKRRAPRVAEVEKWGGKVFLTFEARDRNDQAGFANKVRQLANTQVRKINQRAIEVLDASITEKGQTFTGRDWSAVVVGGSSQSNADLFPLRDFAEATRLAEVDELGVVYNLVILNPQEYAQLVIIYGPNGLRDILGELGYTLYVSNRQTAGSAKYLAERQVGEMRVEKPLGTVTWTDEESEREFMQSSVRPVMYATNPFAILEATGLAG